MKLAILGIIAMTAQLAAGTPVALASGGAKCAATPSSDWKSKDDVRAAAEALGYRNIRKIEVDDNCYEAYAFDKQGNRVEIYFDPVSLKVVKSEIDD